MFKIWMINLQSPTFQVVLPEGSKDPSAVVPHSVEQRLEVTQLINSYTKHIGAETLNSVSTLFHHVNICI